jgi:hypothetical protein
MQGLNSKVVKNWVGQEYADKFEKKGFFSVDTDKAGGNEKALPGSKVIGLSSR